MFSTRPRKSTAAVSARQGQEMAEFAVENSDVPLKEQWADRWYTLPKSYENIMTDVLNFEVRPRDVFVVTSMKSGTTWIQEAAYVLMNNLDFENSKQTPIHVKSVFLDFSGVQPKAGNTIERCNKMADPRLIKLHLPANFLPYQVWQKKQKIIYVARNVKDVVVSSYHFVKGLGYWNGNIDEYVEDFINNDIMYTPFWAHIVDFWRMRHEPNIFFVTYEEMQRDLASVLQRLCKFLDRPELNANELKQTVAHLSFDNMKKNPGTNPTFTIKATKFHSKVADDFQFLRRGIVGSYKDELTAEHRHRLDEWSAEFLGKLGIKEEDIFGQI